MKAYPSIWMSRACPIATSTISLACASAAAIPPSSHSLWADTAADEGRIWREFLAILETLEKPVLIHYGSYETAFLKRMGERHGQPPEVSLAAKTIGAAVNLLSVIYAQVYYSDVSNGLKEIARHLGFRWSDSNATGTQAIRWRHEWEASETPSRNHCIVTYNVEDCTGSRSRGK